MIGTDRIPERVRDLALLVLGAVVLAASAYVVLGAPGTGTQRLSVDTPDRPSATGRSQTAGPSPSPTALPVTALVVGSDVAGAGPALTAASGWQVTVDGVPETGYLTGGPGRTYEDRLRRLLPSVDPDVVVLASGPGDGEEVDVRRLGGAVQSTLHALRQELPDAEVVVLGPASADPDGYAAQREMLIGVSSRYGAFFVDPVGARYVVGRPDLLDADGGLTPDGWAVVAPRLAKDLRIVLPAGLVPAA